MNILVIGNQSFIGKNLVLDLLNRGHLVFHTSRSELDLTNLKSFKDYLSYHKNHNKCDIVINCAISGGSHKEDSQKTLDENIKMTCNLLECSNEYSKLIHFGSGVERLSDFTSKFYYRSKSYAAKRFKGNNKVIKLNLWGVFGKWEHPNRFINLCINNCLNNKNIVINNNRPFDFFYIKDLSTVVGHLIKKLPKQYFELDCVYPREFYFLSDIANMIKDLTNSRSNVIINNNHGVYCGNSGDIEKLGLPLIGLKDGIKEYISEIKAQKLEKYNDANW